MSQGCQLTVLMTVFNESRYVRTCIDSILAQSYPDFRFLIVDDASTDDTREIIRSYNDARIDLHYLEDNAGQTAALNVGLQRVKTPWVARMDADDFSAPSRLEEQMGALEADPSLSCVGTWAWIFREYPQVYEGELTPPEDLPDIRRRLLSTTPILHGTIVAKTGALLDVGGYDERYRYAADIELWDRLLVKYTAANLPKKLMGIRYHEGQGQRTITALDEIISIQSRRLASGRYSPEEIAIISSNLSRQHMVLARRMGGQGRFFQLFKSFMRSFRLSPKSSPWLILTVFIGYGVPERYRNRLREFFSRVRSGVRG